MKTLEPGISLTFEQKMLQAIEHTVIDKLRKGEWLNVDYHNRINMDAATLRKAYEQVDMIRVFSLVRSQIEQQIADKIIASMATELATDVKQIMCNKELREDLRATLRQRMRESIESVTEIR